MGKVILESKGNIEYHKFGVYMSKVIVEETGEEFVIAIINRGHLDEIGLTDRGPFGGSFTLNEEEVAYLEHEYPGIAFKADSAHPDKGAQDAKIYLPSQYNRKEFVQYVLDRLNRPDRIVKALTAELGEEFFEEKIGESPPPLSGLNQSDVMAQIQIIPGEDEERRYQEEISSQKFKYGRHTDVVMPQHIVDVLKESPVVAVLTEEDYERGSYKEYPFTSTMYKVLERAFGELVEKKYTE